LNISEIKDKFKVGDRIALALPYFYPAKETRTDAYCQKAQMEKYLCNHAVIYDKLDADIKTLLMGNTVSSETVVYPFSISDDLSLNGFNRNQQNNDED